MLVTTVSLTTVTMFHLMTEVWEESSGSKGKVVRWETLLMVLQCRLGYLINNYGGRLNLIDFVWSAHKLPVQPLTMINNILEIGFVGNLTRLNDDKNKFC